MVIGSIFRCHTPEIISFTTPSLRFFDGFPLNGMRNGDVVFEVGSSVMVKSLVLPINDNGRTKHFSFIARKESENLVVFQKSRKLLFNVIQRKRNKVISFHYLFVKLIKFIQIVYVFTFKNLHSFFTGLSNG